MNKLTFIPTYAPWSWNFSSERYTS
jgi:hypothetical protein